MATNLKGSQVINGSWVEIWLDDELLGQATALQAKIEKQTEEVKFAGDLSIDRKVVGYKGSGSLTIHKVSTKFQKAAIEEMKKGIEPEFSLIYRLYDPALEDAGEERCILKNVRFDDITIIDLEVGSLMKQELPFSFKTAELIDSIG